MKENKNKQMDGMVGSQTSNGLLMSEDVLASVVLDLRITERLFCWWGWCDYYLMWGMVGEENIMRR
jgi:hypothetical protein